MKRAQKETEKIRGGIARALEDGYRKFVIFPFGDMGRRCKEILNECFDIQEEVILDSFYSKYSSKIKPLEYLDGFDADGVALLFTLEDVQVEEPTGLLAEVGKHFPADQIYVCFPTKGKRFKTICGKYSYGPLCDHWLVERVGAFSSFAIGTDVVQNHATGYITTSPFIYHDPRVNPPLAVGGDTYEDFEESDWYFEGVCPHAVVKKLRRITIGNDVWLGKNVTITNGANIGNGVIAGSGAIITKDVPDYAIVVGAPARIIKYRYTPEQIESLNKIAWWDWPDEKIRECYEDLYLDADAFIAKHIND